MSKYVIEDNIPIPGTITGAIRQLKVGQSVFFPGKQNASINAMVRRVRKGRKFTTRSMDGGVRVWRIE